MHEVLHSSSKPELSIDTVPSTKHVQMSNMKKKRNLLNHSLAKDLHKGRFDEGIFMMSADFKNDVRGSLRIATNTAMGNERHRK